jgi:hypothetical protein
MVRAGTAAAICQLEALPYIASDSWMIQGRKVTARFDDSLCLASLIWRRCR